MKFLSCVGFIVVIFLIVGCCFVFMSHKEEGKYIPSQSGEDPIVLDKTPSENIPAQNGIDKLLSPAVRATASLPAEEPVLNEKILDWALTHSTADYQQYVTAGDAIQKCDDAMNAIKEELETAGLADRLNQNKAYNRLLREKVGAIKEKNKYAGRIISAYAENIGNTASEVASANSGVSREESRRYIIRGTINSDKNGSGEPASKRLRNIEK